MFIIIPICDTIFIYNLPDGKETFEASQYQQDAQIEQIQ